MYFLYNNLIIMSFIYRVFKQKNTLVSILLVIYNVCHLVSKNVYVHACFVVFQVCEGGYCSLIDTERGLYVKATARVSKALGCWYVLLSSSGAGPRKTKHPT